MKGLPVTPEHVPETSPKTLGDLLYAKPKARVPEGEWVALVHAIAAGDQLALHALFGRAHRIVFTLILRMTGNRETAEELTVDVFHDVWRRAARFDAANGTVLGWVMTQARSRAIDRLRFDGRKKRRERCAVDPETESFSHAPDPIEIRQQGESLQVALAALTADERQAIETTFFDGMTYAEAAVRLNQPLGTVKTRIRSALQKLRRALAPESRTP